MKKYLGIDLGSKSLGLAISTSGIIANSYQTLYFKEDNYHDAAHIINKLIKSEAFTDIVIGLPKHMNNDLGIRGQISVDFKTLLEANNPNINVVLWDERTSTKAALKTLIAGKQTRKKQKNKKDEVAATIILQNYLNYKEKNNYEWKHNDFN